MAFHHNLFLFEQLPVEEIEGVRYYTTPQGDRFKSVTTILSEYYDASKKSGMVAWKERIGETQANKITKMAARKGTSIHSMFEKYLLNTENPTKGQMPFNIQLFKDLKPFLDKIEEVNAIEAPLYSYNLKTAGKTDCIGIYEGTRSIIDFKGSVKPKKEEWIENYFVQTAAYATMCEELKNIEVPQIVVMVAVDHDKPQIFIKKTDNYRHLVKRIFQSA